MELDGSAQTEPLLSSEVLYLRELQETGDLDKAYAYVRLLQDYRSAAGASTYDRAYLHFVRGFAQKRAEMADHGISSFKAGIDVLEEEKDQLRGANKADEHHLYNRLRCALHLSKLRPLATGKTEPNCDEEKYMDIVFGNADDYDDAQSDGGALSDGSESLRNETAVVAAGVSSGDRDSASIHEATGILADEAMVSPPSSQVDEGDRSFDMSGVADAVSSAPSSVHEGSDDDETITAFLAKHKMEI